MYKNKRIIAFDTFSFGGSKGIKHKNIEIQRIPLIAYTANLIKQVEIIDEAITSTDSNKIANIAKKYDLKFHF